jgi:hypothetical protein
LSYSDLQKRILHWIFYNQSDISVHGLLKHQQGLLKITDTYSQMKYDIARDIDKVDFGRRGKKKIKKSFHPTFSNSFKALVKHEIVTEKCKLTQKGLEIVEKII